MKLVSIHRLVEIYYCPSFFDFSGVHKLFLVAPRKFLANPIWITAQVQNRDNLGFHWCFAVINAEGKSFRQHSVKPKLFEMDGAKEFQQAFPKIASHTAGYYLIDIDKCRALGIQPLKSKTIQ
jgi:hypothetical protein